MLWTGQRSGVYATLYSYTTVALGVGPLITAIVFQVHVRACGRMDLFGSVA